MSLYRLLLAASVLAIAACANPLGSAADCYYDKTASAAPGNQICSPTDGIGSDLPAVQ